MKEERNKAEKRELMWKEKYEDQVGDPEKPKKGKTKIISHSGIHKNIVPEDSSLGHRKNHTKRGFP